MRVRIRPQRQVTRYGQNYRCSCSHLGRERSPVKSSYFGLVPPFHVSVKFPETLLQLLIISSLCSFTTIPPCVLYCGILLPWLVTLSLWKWLLDAGSTKRKLSHAEGLSSELGRSQRSTKRAELCIDVQCKTRSRLDV